MHICESKNRITQPYPKKLCAQLVNINEIAKKIIFDLGNLGGSKIYVHIYLFIYGFNYLPVSLTRFEFSPCLKQKRNNSCESNAFMKFFNKLFMKDF